MSSPKDIASKKRKIGLSSNPLEASIVELLKQDNSDALFHQKPPIEHNLFTDRNTLLHLASQYSTNKTTMLALLNNNILRSKLKDLNNKSNTILHTAIDAGNNETTDAILTFIGNYPTEKSFLIDHPNSDNLTPICLSIRINNHKAVRHLIEAGANLLKGDVNNNTPLHLVVSTASISQVQTIQEAALSLPDGKQLWNKMNLARNRIKKIPIMLTNIDEILTILAKSFNIEEIIDEHDGTLWHWASENNKIDLIKVLTKRKLDANINNHRKLSPLKIACKRGNYEIVELLLKSGADPNFIGYPKGATAINDAAQFGRLEIIELLVNYDAWTSKTERMKKSALDSACFGGHADVVKYLLDKLGMSPDSVNTEGNTPLFYAINESKRECVKILLSHFPDINAYTGSDSQSPCEVEKNQKPIHLAVRKGDRQILEMILKSGAKPEEALDNGVNAVMLTTISDNASLLPLLMAKGNFVQRCDLNGNTILHHIALNNSVKCAEFVTQKMKKMSHVTPFGEIYHRLNVEQKTPFKIALELEYEEVLAVFIKYAESQFFHDNPEYLEVCIDKRLCNTLQTIFEFVPRTFFEENPKFLHRLLDQRLYGMFKYIFPRVTSQQNDYVMIHTKFLDANNKGEYPNDLHYTNLLPSFLHRLLKCPDVELKYNPVVNVVVSRKIRFYRWWYVISLVYYLIFLSALSFAFYLSSIKCDGFLWNYTETIDIFRGICECIVIFMTITFAIDEVMEFFVDWRMTFVNKKERDQIETNKQDDDAEIKISKNLTRFFDLKHLINNADYYSFRLISTWRHYFSLFNILDLLSYLFLFLWIILRFTESPYIWTFSSLAYMCFTLGLFKYTRIIPSLGSYVQTVFRIFQSDIPQFSIIICIFMISYIGSIHLAARQQFNTIQSSPGTILLPNGGVCINSSNTGFIWFDAQKTANYDLKRPLVSSLIFLLDGGPGNVEDNLFDINFLFSALYLFFAFCIIVVMSNILIAQLTQTYSDIFKTNSLHYKLDLIVNLELKTNLSFIVRCFVCVRKLSMVETVFIPKYKWLNWKERSPKIELEKQVENIYTQSKTTSGVLEAHIKSTDIRYQWTQDKLNEVLNGLESYHSVEPLSRDTGRPMSSDTQNLALKVTRLETKLDEITRDNTLLMRKLDDIAAILNRKSGL